MTSKREQLFWRNILRVKMRAMGHCCRIESAITPGMPDLNLQLNHGPEVWIELKAVDSKNGLVFRNSQWVWYKKRKKATGGKHYFILTVWDHPDGNRYYFLNNEPVDSNKPDDWMSDSGVIWRNKIDFDQLEGILRHA